MIQKQNSRTSNTGYSNTIKRDVKSNNSNTIETIKNSNVTNTNNNTNSNNSNKSSIKRFLIIIIRGMKIINKETR